MIIHGLFDWVYEKKIKNNYVAPNSRGFLFVEQWVTLDINRYSSILLSIGLASRQIFDSKGISYGIEDTETGISLVGINLSKNIDEKYTIFFGQEVLFMLI